MELETLCRICLAVDRKLEPPGKYGSLLNLLAPDACGCIPLPVTLCWECRATLRRVRTLAGRARRSAVLLLQVWDAARCGDVQRPLEMLAYQCISSMQCHTEINCVPPAQPNTDHTLSINCNENEVINVESQLTEVNVEFEIKTESKFDLDDDIPLIKHKKIKEKRKRRTKKEPNSIDDVKFEFLSERIRDDDILDGEEVEFSSNVDKPTKQKKNDISKKGTVKRKKNVCIS